MEPRRFPDNNLKVVILPDFNPGFAFLGPIEMSILGRIVKGGEEWHGAWQSGC